MAVALLLELRAFLVIIKRNDQPHRPVQCLSLRRFELSVMVLHPCPQVAVAARRPRIQSTLRVVLILWLVDHTFWKGK